jgi:hypothetical protein
MLGNSNIGAWEWIPLINSFPQAIFGDDQHISNGMIQTKLVNEKLKWEVITQTNLGLDLSMLDNRLQLSADYFIKDSKDVLAPMPILDVTGNSGGNPLLNAASIRNNGVELSLTWGDNVGGVKYSVNLNGTYLKNKITSLGGRQDGFDEWNTKSDLGKPIGEWYLIKTDGIFRTDAEVPAHKNSAGVLIQPEAQKGDLRYIDDNDDGKITDADRQHCGSNTPKFLLGSNITVQYKGFDVLMQITGAFGHKIFNGPRSAYDRFDDNSNYRADYDPWSIDNPNAKDPRPIYGDSRNSRGNQDRWLENGNYLRLSQFALGYTLPQTLLKNTFKQIRAYVNLQNMITLTSYTGLDPEFLNTNIWMRSYDYGAFPNPRGITFGIQLSF